MTAVLQVGNQAIAVEEIIPLLSKYHMLPQLVGELIIDQAVSAIACTPEEIARACQQFSQNKQNGMTHEQLEALAIRQLKIEKFKARTWGHKLESYFLSRKGSLDKVIYSLIRTSDAEVAQELYFRVQEGEQSFAELARQYSQGPEANTSGLIGSVEISTIHPTLAKMLALSQPGQLWPPIRLAEWLVIVRLEKFIPATLDEQMKWRLLNELFAAWLQEQLNQLDSVLKIPDATTLVAS